MPVCYVTVSEKSPVLSNEQLIFIRKAIANGLNSKSRKLDETHISLRINKGTRNHMLGDIEVEIFSQVYLRRLFSRDERAKQISCLISRRLECSCATWINMGFVGYSRACSDGTLFFSDSDNKVIHFIQKLRGISTQSKA